MRHYGLLATLLVAVAAGCSGDGGTTEAARARDHSGCRTSSAERAFRHEISAARPLVLRMKRAFGAPGLTLAVAVRGRVVWSESCGYADVGRRAPVTATTGFRIGSVSKTFTAAAAARLVQRGELDLDAPVQRYVRSFPTKPYRVTVRGLLAHTAGIRHYEGDEALSDRRYASVTAALRVFARDPLLFEPGTQYAYSSYGFNLVGAAIEAIAREPYARAVRSLVLEPLRLHRTSLDDGRTRPDWARIYEVTGSRRAVRAPVVDLSNRYPSGGFRSTAEDLARFGSRLGDDGFLHPAVQGILFRRQQLADGTKTEQGLGFDVAESPLGTFVGHTGNVVGGAAFLLAHPEAGVAVALASNIGYVTAPTPPELRGVPDPPDLLLPFLRRVLTQAH